MASNIASWLILYIRDRVLNMTKHPSRSSCHAPENFYFPTYDFSRPATPRFRSLLELLLIEECVFCPCRYCVPGIPFRSASSSSELLSRGSPGFPDGAVWGWDESALQFCLWSWHASRLVFSCRRSAFSSSSCCCMYPSPLSLWERPLRVRFCLCCCAAGVSGILFSKGRR